MTVVILAGLCFFMFIILVKEKRKEKNEKEKIIYFLEKVLCDEHNEYACNEESELSRVEFLLKCFEQKQMLCKEAANKEQEKIKGIIANLSHQLKTPLSNVKLYETFLEDVQLPEDKRNMFQEKMCRQIQKLEWILSTLIKCARLEEGAIEFKASQEPIQNTIMQAIDTVSFKAAERNIEIMAEGGLPDILLYHHPNWTREVFVNLLENAIKYSPENSKIVIKSEVLSMYTQISIIDQGMGIKEEEYAQIFQRFYRGKDAENIEGSGIGLYLCRLIMEKQQGNIFVSSTYGSGSVFAVYLLNEGR